MQIRQFGARAPGVGRPESRGTGFRRHIAGSVRGCPGPVVSDGGPGVGA